MDEEICHLAVRESRRLVMFTSSRGRVATDSRCEGAECIRRHQMSFELDAYLAGCSLGLIAFYDMAYGSVTSCPTVCPMQLI